jgi:hypothetical protein
MFEDTTEPGSDRYGLERGIERTPERRCRSPHVRAIDVLRTSLGQPSWVLPAIWFNTAFTWSASKH